MEKDRHVAPKENLSDKVLLNRIFGRPDNYELKSFSDLEPEMTVQANKYVEMLLGGIDVRSRKVVMLRYGLMDGRTRLQREVAREIGLSRSAIGRIERRALEQMKRDSHPANQ